jgi:diguanylate cyclase (GGDEF)-like protein
VRILVAQYNATARLSLTRLLEHWRHEVVATADAAEAWQVMRSPSAPRVAILDWSLPEMDGAKVCRRVRALPAARPPYLLLLTARGGKEAVVEGLRAGADDYLTKPYDAEELRARLDVGLRLVALTDDLLDAQEALRIQARTDPLTGVLNRGAVLGELAAECRAAAYDGRGLGVGMLDIDHFKRVNDTFGHAAGDLVLREVVRRVRTALRSGDVLGRFGGEEFLIVVPGAGSPQLSGALEDVRHAVAAAPVDVDGRALAVTASLGGALHGGEPVDALIARADAALYAAKERGRDRVELA